MRRLRLSAGTYNFSTYNILIVNIKDEWDKINLLLRPNEEYFNLEKPFKNKNFKSINKASSHKKIFRNLRFHSTKSRVLNSKKSNY